MHYYTLASNQGHASARNNLGYLYQQKGEIDKAKIYYQLVAQQENELSQFHLGEICEKEGDEIQADYYYGLCINSFIKENNKHNEQSQYEPASQEDYKQCILGFIYQEQGDLNRAKEHYFKAAQLGNVTAQYKLGLILIEQDLEEAKKNLTLAYQQGHKSAKLKLDSI